ncbi:hypothetical protein [Thermus sp. CCB_US3_UF1]|uniref:hypothetical protein n=1 Tax=Thermus sp. CCB_US3_UF1 TaxID=1111069 RepID=UPI0009DB03F4|nr:hypothetical protein [Thermus sp. CCB_US3_UF1]
MGREKVLLSVKDLREELGEDLIGRDTAYKIARQLGIKLGRRWLVPREVLEQIKRGQIKKL